MEINYTDHLKKRLKIRKIPEEYPRKIYENPDQKFHDTAEGTFIAIKKLYYNKNVRSMMIAYKESGENVEIITVHPITEEKIINRIMRGRWIRHE
ncbi:MAG: hypothetical protein HYX24_07660 [Candidatus Aenigmarchaeota archaeon]|nr:hypothetical protein [Candidatus Aenigmarchaeota archaeon]